MVPSFAMFARFVARARSIRFASFIVHGRSLLLSVVLAVLFSLITGRVANAASLVVNSIADTNDGVCDANCTLREAITAANANAGADTITFNLNGTIVLTGTLPVISNDVSIDGTGHAITVSGKNLYQVLTVNAGKILTLGSLTIAYGGGDQGGAIYNGGALNITNSTFSNNKAGVAGGGIYSENATMTLKNSIIANSIAGGDCANNGGSVTGSNNLIEDATNACGLTNGVNGNIIGSDPLLGPLVNNGGSTLTLMPLPGSLAIDTGANAGCPATDRRGISRPQGSVCDIGAVETVIWLFQYLPMVLR